MRCVNFDFNGLLDHFTQKSVKTFFQKKRFRHTIYLRAYITVLYCIIQSAPLGRNYTYFHVYVLHETEKKSAPYIRYIYRIYGIYIYAYTQLVSTVLYRTKTIKASLNVFRRGIKSFVVYFAKLWSLDLNGFYFK